MVISQIQKEEFNKDLVQLAEKNKIDLTRFIENGEINVIGFLSTLGNLQLIPNDVNDKIKTILC